MKHDCQQEFDFALIVDGVQELTDNVLDALYEAGCDDATFSIQFGVLYAEFSRSASTIQDAILSAIRDIQNANVGAVVRRVDDCNYVTQAEIARRIGRSRQLVHQYITGKRGPGKFPPPACYLTDAAPLWPWCAVSFWFAENGIIRPEEGWNAEVVDAINVALDSVHHRNRNPDLANAIREIVHS